MFMKPILALFLATLVSAHAVLPEPDIVFFGKVLHLGGGEEYLVTSGELQWQVDPLGPSQYTTFTQSTALGALKGGTMSYAIRIPNHLVVPGTIGGVEPGLARPHEDAIPFKNTAITINGQSVRLADPDGFTFLASSEDRALFRRLDLILEGDLPDADGDGLPDWWEEKYGTQANLADANSDLDGDGLSNLAEYRSGTHPALGDAAPKLAQEYRVSVPIGGAAVPMVQAIDGDSHPSELRYTITTLPSDFEVEVLGIRGVFDRRSFTQADVLAGRVLLHHRGSTAMSASIPVRLEDEDPDHDPVTTTLRLTVADADTLWEAWGLPQSNRPDIMPVVHDASTMAGSGEFEAPTSKSSSERPPDWEKSRLFVSSERANVFHGSALDDWFIARAGDQLAGARGGDRFLMATASGDITLTDFDPFEDVIDLRGLLPSTPGETLAQHVRRQGNALVITAQGQDDLVVHLPEQVRQSVDDLWDMGALETGPIVPMTTLFVAVTGSASEEDLTPATITLRRRGSAANPLTVPISWSGTATMGIDYAALPSTVTFAIDEKAIALTVQPLADDQRETNETVQLNLTAGDAWSVADTQDHVQLTIMDLPSRVWLERVQPVAFVNGLSPALLHLRRSGPMNAPLTVKLQFSGSAIAGLDYERLSGSVSFSVAQAVIPLTITPLPTANLSEEIETVRVRILEDAHYLFGESMQERVSLVSGPRTVAQWMAQRQIAVDADAFLREDTDRDGLNGLVEFAFNRDPHEPESWKVRGILDATACPGLEFERWASAPEIRYVLQRSHNLEQWQDVPESHYREVPDTVLPGGLERVQVYLREIPEDPYTYLRIDVRTQP